MPKTLNLPSSLSDAIRYFADKDVAHTFLVSLRWPNGAFCPACEAKNPGFLKTRRIYKCRDCGRQFSVKLGTIFEDSPLGLDKWLPAIWMLANAKNGISFYELRGAVEADESFIGGAAKFMHKSKRKRFIRGTGGLDKTPVLGMLERSKGVKLSRVRAVVVKNVEQDELRKQIVASVKKGSKLYTDTT